MTLCCLPEDRLEHRMALLNTCTGQVQPGAFFIKWVTKKRLLRNSQESDTITSCYERYGDGVSHNMNQYVKLMEFHTNNIPSFHLETHQYWATSDCI